MKYPFIITAVIVLLIACGDPKPGQYPPSLYSDKAEKIYPADDPSIPHAKSDKELSAEKVEKAYPADDPAVPHAKSDEELTAEKVEKAYPAEDAAPPRRGGY